MQFLPPVRNTFLHPKGATTLIKYLLPQPIPDRYFPKEVAAHLRRISESGYCFFILLAKRPYPSFVGKGLFASSGATTFLNVRQNICATFQVRTFCLRPFCKRGCGIFAGDNYYPAITMVKLLFTQRPKKRSKRTSPD